MSIKYYLQPNPFAPDPNNQYAQVAANATLTVDDIVKKMLERGTTLTETDLIAMMHLLFVVVSDEVAAGNAVVSPLINIRPCITGAFNNRMDAFENGRHRKSAHTYPGVLLKEKMKQAKVEKIVSSQRAPQLLGFKDINSGSTDRTLSPGGIGQIGGSELKFNPANEAEGIFLVNKTLGITTKIVTVASCTGTKLMFSIPGDLTTGNYILQVRKAYGKAGTIRIGTLNHILSCL